MAELHQQLVERLYDAFNRRDEAAIAEVCGEEMEFFPVTAEALGRSEPYVGPAGLRDYLIDVATAWEELLVTPCRIDRCGDCLLVDGRVYVRSRDLGIRDMPVAWIWRLHDGVFVRGEVFPDPQVAATRFEAIAA